MNLITTKNTNNKEFKELTNNTNSKENNDQELIQQILTFPFQIQDEKLYLFIIISNVSDLLIQVQGNPDNKPLDFNTVGQITSFRVAREPIGFVDMARTIASNIKFLHKNQIIQHFNPFLYTSQFFTFSEEKKSLIEDFLIKETSTFFSIKDKNQLKETNLFKKKSFFLQNILDQQSLKIDQQNLSVLGQEQEQGQEGQEDEIQFLFSSFFKIYEKYKLLGNQLTSKDKELKKFRKEFQHFIDFFNQNSQKENENFLLSSLLKKTLTACSMHDKMGVRGNKIILYLIVL